MTGGALVQTVALVSPLVKTNKVVPFLDDLIGEDFDDLLKEDTLTEVNLTGEDPEVVPASSTKPVSNKDGVRLADEGGASLEVVPASSTKPISNQDGIGFANDDALNGSSNEMANKSPKDIDIGGVGAEIIPASSTKPVLNKGGVGFAVVVVLSTTLP